jgi:glycosyltransferase 2 family protein
MIIQPANDLPQVKPFLRRWHFWLGLVVSMICLGLVFQDVNFKVVGVVLQNVNGWFVLLAVLSVLATFVFKAVRWKLLLKEEKPVFQRVFSIQSIGMFLNVFVLARLGDLASAYLMGEALSTSKIFTLGTIVVVKIFDLLFLFISLLLVVSQIALPAWLISPTMRLGLIVGLIVVLVGLLSWHRRAVAALLTRLAGHLPVRWSEWFIQKISSALKSLEVFRRPEQFAGVLAWTLLIWALSVLTNLLLFAAMGLHLPIWAGILLLAVLQVGVTVPSSPGLVGIFHYLVMITLLAFVVGREAALGCAVLLHLVTVVPIGIVGSICLWREKVTWEKLNEAVSHLNNTLRRTE